MEIVHTYYDVDLSMDKLILYTTTAISDLVE
jgi:hypothetical protein